MILNIEPLTGKGRVDRISEQEMMSHTSVDILGNFCHPSSPWSTRVGQGLGGSGSCARSHLSKCLPDTSATPQPSLFCDKVFVQEEGGCVPGAEASETAKLH